MGEENRGELKPSEPHPAAGEAFAYVKGLSVEKLYRYLEAFYSCAIEGNRLGEICAETINRIIKGKSVSDRYLLGLAWTLRNMELGDGIETKIKEYAGPEKGPNILEASVVVDTVNGIDQKYAEGETVTVFVVKE